MSTKFSAVALATTLLAMPLLAAPALADGIEVHDAYAITARPGAPTGAAFMVIHNHGGAPDHLLSVSSPVAERVELHTHVMDANGVAQMMEVEDGWALPTDGEIVLQRGAEHVMFMGITAPFEDGSEIPLTLMFENAGPVEITVTVDLDRMTGDAMDHGNMDHGTMDHESMDHGAHAGHGG
jgi:copper(I)-binding protein